MNISFVLAVYNKLDLTKECYRYLRNQYPDAPLVISSGGSSDGFCFYLTNTPSQLNISYILNHWLYEVMCLQNYFLH